MTTQYKKFFSKFMKAQKNLNGLREHMTPANFKECKALLNMLQVSFIRYASGNGPRSDMEIDLDMWANFGQPLAEEAKTNQNWILWCKGRRNAEVGDAFYGINGTTA